MTARGTLGTTLFLLAATFSLSGCGRPFDSELVLKFQQAQEQFEDAESQEDYLRVAGQYDEIRRAGVTNGAVLYNQGNAYMRAGQRGRAIACYRIALRYRPLDPDLQENLRFALEPIQQPPPKRSVIDYMLFWQGWISYPGKFQLATACAALAFALGVVALFIKRNTLRRTAWGALLFTMIFGLSATYDWYRFDVQQKGVVTGNEVTARRGNAESYEPAFNAALEEGIEFQVLERREKWLRIRVAAGVGWVKASDVVTFY